MRIEFLKTRDKGIPVSDSFGKQVVIGLISSDWDEVVLYFDSTTDKYYIERIKSKLIIEKFSRANFEWIPSDEEWNAYRTIFLEAGVSLEEKLCL